MELHCEVNKRENKRYTTSGLISNTTNGLESFMGVIDNVSTTGLRLSNVPTNFDDTIETCYSIVSSPKRYYSFALRPRWVRITDNGMSKMIGFEIENPPASWHRFVESISEN